MTVRPALTNDAPQRRKTRGVHWVARVVADGRPPLHATCRDVGEAGLTFICEESFPVGVELTLWVGWPSAARPGQVDWTPFSLRVTSHGSSEWRYRMEAEFHLTLPESLHALRRVLLAEWRAGEPTADGKRATVSNRRRALLGSGSPLSHALVAPADAHVVFHFEGVLDQTKVRSLVTQARKRLQSSHASPAVARGALAVMAELLRNAEMHGVTAAEMGLRGEEADRPQAAVLVALGAPAPSSEAHWASKARVTCVSLVHTKTATQLEPLFRALHSLSPEAVRARMSAVLKSPDWRAGVGELPTPRFGMLTLARECREPIEVRCTPIEPGNSKFARLSVELSI